MDIKSPVLVTQKWMVSEMEKETEEHRQRLGEKGETRVGVYIYIGVRV